MICQALSQATLQDLEHNAVSIPVLSFFTGGGFLDLGFEEAGFDIVWTNEHNPAFADMYEYGITAWRKSKGTLPQPAKISNREDITTLSAPGIMEEAFGKERPPFFGTIGGPPCPDFSIGGKNGGHKGKNGRLTRTFVDQICNIKPDFFVIENVPGLCRTKKHREFLDEMIGQLRKDGSYAVDATILRGLELGIPQDRERLFIIGFKRHLIPLEGEKAIDELGWFPWPEPIYHEPKKLPWPKTSEFHGNPVLPERIPAELTVYPLLAGESDPETLPNGKDYFNANSPKFEVRLEGDVQYKSFKRLHRHRYSPTVWYGNNEVHLHPWKPRRLSVREALRIQTVPDTYILPDASTLSAKFKLICNGVPCKMAESLARATLKFISTLDIEDVRVGDDICGESV